MKKISMSLIAVLMGVAILASGAFAIDYPQGPVSVIVPYGAGGGTDLVARALVDTIKGKFPQGIAVENRTGGGGAVGMSYGQNARPDGRVITMITVELVTLPHTGTGADIDHRKFAPIAMVNSAPAAISVRKDSPYATLKDLIEAAKTKQLQAGNSGIGAIWHLGASGLEQAAGVEFVHIPFQGAAPAITALLGGHIDFVPVSYAEVASQVKAGELRVLAVLADQRLAEIPDVPTAKELGYDAAIGTWRGFAVPKATPPEIVAWLEQTITEACKDEKFIKFMRDSQNDIDLLDSKAFGEKLDRDFELFGKLIKALGLNN